jgi:hypothetical protein
MNSSKEEITHIILQPDIKTAWNPQTNFIPGIFYATDKHVSAL